MAFLVLMVLLWLGLHIGVSGTSVRDTLVLRVGERSFRAIFSLLTTIALILLILAYRGAPLILVWVTPVWIGWVLVLLMLPAFILLVGSIARRNPTAVGGQGTTDEPRGVFRITRHPMLWAAAIWGFVHVVGNGDLASWLFFGAFLVTALAGMPSIDRKLAARSPAAWERLAAATSIAPGRAIAEGRNRLVLEEIGLTVPIAGAVLWIALLFLHPWLFGVPPLPGS
ncbi:MAG: NnrU family protein [Acetobacteraceae bacterium]|nr:NnrU family protein [Acetobacteraceae bacterium]